MLLKLLVVEDRKCTGILCTSKSREPWLQSVPLRRFFGSEYKDETKLNVVPKSRGTLDIYPEQEVRKRHQPRGTATSTVAETSALDSSLW